jgi:hypothetical protein
MTTDWAVFWQAATAIATLAAVLVALGLPMLDSRRRVIAKEREQADQISGWMAFLPDALSETDGEMYVTLLLQNSSERLVYDLIASVVTAFGENPVGSDFHYRNYIGRLPPGRSTYKIRHPGQGMNKRFSVELAFRDASERVWIRRGRGKLERSPKGDTLAIYDITPPVGWLMP